VVCGFSAAPDEQQERLDDGEADAEAIILLSRSLRGASAAPVRDGEGGADVTALAAAPLAVALARARL
jgi:hypothetical protein